MSQDAPQETQPQHPGPPDEPPQDEPGSGGSSIRLIVLVCFLLLFGGLLGYDRLVARPAAAKADQALADLIEERSNTSDPIERENVHQAIGREPSEYENQKGSRYKMDVFRWRAGAPWRSYEVYVVYTGIGDDLFYHTHYLNQQPPENERPGFEPKIPSPAGPPEGLMVRPSPPSDGGEEARPTPADAELPPSDAPTESSDEDESPDAVVRPPGRPNPEAASQPED